MKHLLFGLGVALATFACSDDDDDQRRIVEDDAGAGGSGGSDPSTGGSAGSGGSGGTTDPDASAGGQAGSGGGAGAPDGGDAAALGPCPLDDGQCIFRHDTFGDEQLWTDTLRLHEAVGTLTPVAALGVGLKVDSEMVPADVLANADLEDPATTVALLDLGAVLGVSATVEDGSVTSIGITCAICHSIVDDSVMPGIGVRIDGPPNRDLDPGAIIALTPGLGTLADDLGMDEGMLRTALQSWGPGRYDARFNQDGINAPVLIPPAYGLADVPLETYTGDGPVSYWNNYVAVTQMGGHGSFEDEALGIDIVQMPDLVTPKLPALRQYELSLEPPAPGEFDAAAAARGETLFTGDAGCAACHSGESFTDAPTLHDPSETGMNPVHAERSKTGQYRATPLRGVSSHPPFFHDGSAATLLDVVNHYDTTLSLGLTGAERNDLVEYLKSL